MKESKFRKFFSNNITLLVLSFIIAFVIWFVISANSTTDQSVTIGNIPITVELPKEAVEDGLEIFAGGNETGSVEVTGNRVTIGSLTSNDIQISATNSSNIITSGTYSLQLTARKVGTKNNYNIVASSLVPSNITVFVDKQQEKEYEIENKVVFEVPEGKYAASTLSESKVTLTGPESEIALIDKVVVEGTVDDIISTTQEISKPLVFLDANGEEVNTTYTSPSIQNLTVTLNVLNKFDANLKVDIVNGPEKHPEIKLSPSILSIACTDEAQLEIKDNMVSAGTLDFSQLTNEDNIVTFDISLPKGCKNLSKETKLTVEIDLSEYERKELVCSISDKFTDEYNIEYADKAIHVVVYGPKSSIEEIKASDVTIYPDFTNILDDISETYSSFEVPLICEMSQSYNDCFAHGKYTTTISISKK